MFNFAASILSTGIAFEAKYVAATYHCCIYQTVRTSPDKFNIIYFINHF
jgi:hypothetical protein